MKQFYMLLILVGISYVSTAQVIGTSYHPEIIQKNKANLCALQDDGKIIVAGNFAYANGIRKYSVARINNDGTLDEQFDPGTGPNYYISQICIDSENKIILSGSFTSFNGSPAKNIVRLNQDGSVDNTFDVGLGPNANIYDLDTTFNGKLLVAGNFSQINGINVLYVARLNSNGSVDTTFTNPTGLPGYPTTMEIKSDGSIYLEIYASTVVKLDKDGNIDQSFVFGTHDLHSGQIFSLLPQEEGVLIGGTFLNFDNSGNGFLVRILNNGNLDTTFNVGDKLNSQVSVIQQLPSGEIIAGGNFTQFDNSPATLISLNEDGSLNKILGTSSTNVINFVGIYSPQNQLFVGGEFTVYNTLSCSGLIKLEDYEVPDPDFIPEFTSEALVEVMEMDKNNKLLVSGSYDEIYGEKRALVRLNVDGTLDTTFNAQLATWAQIYVIEPLDDGNILIGGYITSNTGDNLGYMAKLDQNGSIVPEFTTGKLITSQVYAIEPDGNGKILIGGGFTTVDSTNGYGILRLNLDGSVDNTFTSVLESGTWVNDIALTDSGGILLSGHFYSNGDHVNHIIKIISDGQIDPGFSVDPKPNNVIYKIIVDHNGKIYLGGYFDEINGVIRNNLVRLNQDGSIDHSFDIGTGFRVYPLNYAVINDMELDPEGNLLAAGEFNMYDGMDYNGIVMLDSTGTPDPEFLINNLDFPTEIRSIVITPEKDLFMGGKIIEKESGLAQAVVYAGFPPQAPDSLSASPVSDSISIINWIDNSINELNFVVERKDPGQGSFQLLAVLVENAQSYTDTDGEPNSTYFYRVKAVRFGLESVSSNQDSVTTLLPLPVFHDPDSVNQSTIYISWSTVEGAEYYNLDVSTDIFGTFIPGYEDSLVNNTELQVMGLEENTKYYFRVSAGTSENHSLDSDTLIVNTWPAVPASPTELTVVVNDADQIILSWTDNSDNESGFIIRRKAEDGEYSTIDTVNADVNQYQDDGAENNTNYTYQVASYRKGSGTAVAVKVVSDFSNEGSTIVLGWEITPDNSMVRIYPNPSTDIIYVSLVNVSKFPVAYYLYTREGRVVRQSSLDYNTNSINLAEINSGIYLLLLDIDGIYVRKKVIKY
ncbi:MAG TPA: T9SS type A sorting domain-containing protein [Cyclobacteriaceae bacterium]|nr:T9SS type A sorting domain-containing protein [Cyclobacteriaceae bacterium]